MPPQNPLPISQAPPPVNPAINPQPGNNFVDKLIGNKKILVIILGVILVLVIILILLVMLRSKKTTSNQPPLKTVAADISQEYGLKADGSYYTSVTSPALKNPPRVNFKYTATAPSPHTTASATQSKFTHDIGEVEAEAIAKKFGIQVSPTLIGLGNFHFSDQTQKIDLVVYRKSAGFVAIFMNNSNQASPSAALSKITKDQEAITAAQSYLKSINLWEDDFTQPMGDNPYPKNGVVYQKKSQPNVYFVEFHRGWKTLPILNEIGLLNSPLKDQLIDPKKNLPVDNDISYSSDNLTALQRPDQFNTVTVGVNKSGQITYLQYFIRSIIDQSPVNIKPYDQALAELKSGQGQGILVYPQGQKAPSAESDYTQDQWQQLFPANSAISDEAIIDDAQLAYEEKFITESQSMMIPVYLFRGKAPLKGGVVVNFVALIDGRM